MGFIKTAKHRKFEYQPLYYDKDKETEPGSGEFSMREAFAREKRKTSPISGFYNDSEDSRELRKRSRYKRGAYLLLMLFMAYLVFGMNVPIYIGLFPFFIVLIMFIREANKY